uniref:Sn1-specific diacylglycerol lipase alpha n=1 Tax=Noccaea caerulescens TaxID=107243 RepID=A0A1J3FJW7_NOCCA
MATATMATAAGAAALLYYTLNRKLIAGPSDVNDENSEASTTTTRTSLRIDRVSHRLIQAPATWLETISTLSETLRFTYSETLGKWPIGDLAFGINFLIKRQGLLHVDRVFGGEDSIELKGPEVTNELRYYLHLLTLCWHFSKKPFPFFLEETGFTKEDVLIHEPKAGILKPAFTVLVDHNTNCFLLLIRGTHSIKDTLTAATGGIVPFHHTVVNERGVSNLVLGYAHCGMVAAARCIAKLATPCLLKGLEQYPDYKIKIVGHSLGGGTAALLTYILREQKMLSTATCVTFAPAACMTWELADSGNDFIVSVINGADLVPTFSAASVDDLRAEVTASAWLNDLRNQIERTRILSTVYRSATALGSRLPSMATAKAKVAGGAGAMLRPVSSGTQVVMRRAQSMLTRPALSLSSWSCMGPRRRVPASQSNSEHRLESSEAMSEVRPETSDPLLVTTSSDSMEDETAGKWKSEAECSNDDDTSPCIGVADLDECEDPAEIDTCEERMTEAELWQQLEHDLYHDDSSELPEEADVAKEIKEEEEAVIAEAGVAQPEIRTPEMKESHRFLPPGKIMHIVTVRHEAMEVNEEEEEDGSAMERSETVEEGRVGIFLTPRSLYSKVRLSQRMISDHFMPVYRRQIEALIQELTVEQT